MAAVETIDCGGSDTSTQEVAFHQPVSGEELLPNPMKDAACKILANSSTARCDGSGGTARVVQAGAIKRVAEVKLHYDFRAQVDQVLKNGLDKKSDDGVLKQFKENKQNVLKKLDELMKEGKFEMFEALQKYYQMLDANESKFISDAFFLTPQAAMELIEQFHDKGSQNYQNLFDQAMKQWTDGGEMVTKARDFEIESMKAFTAAEMDKENSKAKASLEREQYKLEGAQVKNQALMEERRHLDEKNQHDREIQMQARQLQEDEEQWVQKREMMLQQEQELERQILAVGNQHAEVAEQQRRLQAWEEQVHQQSVQQQQASQEHGLAERNHRMLDAEAKRKFAEGQRLLNEAESSRAYAQQELARLESEKTKLKREQNALARDKRDFAYDKTTFQQRVSAAPTPARIQAPGSHTAAPSRPVLAFSAAAPAQPSAAPAVAVQPQGPPQMLAPNSVAVQTPTQQTRVVQHVASAPAPKFQSQTRQPSAAEMMSRGVDANPFGPPTQQVWQPTPARATPGRMSAAEGMAQQHVFSFQPQPPAQAAPTQFPFHAETLSQQAASASVPRTQPQTQPQTHPQVHTLPPTVPQLETVPQVQGAPQVYGAAWAIPTVF